jgi:Spy/CpxP family protein refolding chaperone
MGEKREQAMKVFGKWDLSRMNLGLAVAALGVMGAVTAWGQAPGPDGTPGMGPHRPPMERALGMRGDHGRWWNEQRAETQRKAMDDIYQQHRLTLVDLHASLEKQELAMEPLIKADQPDEGQVLAQIDRVAQARAELEKANARMLLGIRKQLTPEQWKQMEADREARRAEHGPGHGDFRRGGPGAGGPSAGGPPPGGPGPMGPDAMGPGGLD